MFPYVFDKTNCRRLEPFPGVEMYVTESPQMTMSLIEMQPNSVIPEHSHPHEQVGCMLEGEAEFIVEGRPQRVVPGQMWRLPGGTRHKVVTGDQPMKSLDVFYPIREDMRSRWKAE